MSETVASGVRVRGSATAEEVAAVLAVVSRAGARTTAPSRYAEWRATRLAALRRHDNRGRRP